MVVALNATATFLNVVNVFQISKILLKFSVSKAVSICISSLLSTGFGFLVIWTYTATFIAIIQITKIHNEVKKPKKHNKSHGVDLNI